MLKAAPNQTVFPTVDSSAFTLSAAGIITEAGFGVGAFMVLSH